SRSPTTVPAAPRRGPATAAGRPGWRACVGGWRRWTGRWRCAARRASERRSGRSCRASRSALRAGLGGRMRVVIAEDNALLREGSVALLRERENEVAAQVEDAPGLLRTVAGHKPDLAIVDVRLPPSFTDEGVRAAIELRRRHPALGVLI